ncbi:replication protein, partial [Xanthomonas citri pv. citri]|nr:replication protein [Xanthomonas citri pv. citri]MBD4978897.1 replication protein [Xanthomonas citri pv. citri]MBD4988132.1 replication protein [Xanthomonas citri pv. citri]MBD4991681.1 replication protein [Xanthomonas citri pv. citri]
APLYTPKNDTLLNLFQITQDEQRQLRTIIGADMAAERNRTRLEARRRAAGAVDRATYESHSAARTRPWEALGMSRRSWYRAGKPGAPADGTSPTVLQATAATAKAVGTGPTVLLMAKPPRSGAPE